MNYKKLINLKNKSKRIKKTSKTVPRKRPKKKKMYSIKSLCLLWSGPQIWPWLSSSHHRNKNPVHSPGDKTEKYSEEELFCVLRPKSNFYKRKKIL